MEYNSSDLNILKQYFPELGDHQLMQFTIAANTYREWNEKINVISRKDIDNILVHHILHSLSIAKVVRFAAGARIADIGTGGGFPGIPLAIFFPKASFTLIDSVGKKLQVANAVGQAVGLQNIQTIHARAENVTEKFDFVTGRAVETIPEFYNHVAHLLRYGNNSSIGNGIFYLKGGDFSGELNHLNMRVKIHDLHEFFDEGFFETKKLIYLPWEQ